MQVVTIESEAFQELMDKIKSIKKQLEEEQEATKLSERWLDNQEVCQLLHISKRTLQNYRDTDKLPYSKVGNKIYYRASDVEKLLNEHYKGDEPNSGKKNTN